MKINNNKKKNDKNNSSWKSKLLNCASRVTLARSVISAIPSYTR